MKCCQAVEIRHKCKEDASLEGKEVRNTIVITFAFQIVFTAFNALQNIHSSLHDEESLGTICLAIISGTAVVSSVLSPTVIGLIGAKYAVVAFFAAQCVYVLANFYPSFATMAPAAVALGAFQGPAWISQALYISASAFSFSKSSSASPYSILSRFNGFFFAVFATSQIVGNLVTSTVIRDGVGNGTDEIVLFDYCGPGDCPSGENASSIEDPEDWVLDITLGFFMACSLLGFILVFFLLSPLPRSEWIQRVSVRSTTTSCFNVLVSTNMIILVPFIFFTAMENAFLLSAYTKSYVACPIGIHMVGYVMAVYGATTPIFVFLVSRLARIAGRFVLLLISLVIHLVLFIVLFFWSPTPDDEAVIFIIPVIWGVAENILQAQANSLIAILFPSQKEPAFANFHAWRSLGYAVTYLNASYMCVSTKLIVCMTCAVAAVLTYTFVEFKTKMKEKMALKKPRTSSVTSIESEEVVMRPTSTHGSLQSNRTSVSSLQSIHDRLSFDRVELTDIIMEAQQGWQRNEDGLTLEIGRVMSMEHLAGSKVTNWYHTRPGITDFSNGSKPRKQNQPVLHRSLSDGHLDYAAYKVDVALVKMSRGRSQTLGERTKTRSIPMPKRRHVSEIVPPNLDVIREIVCEEDELAAEIETEIDSYIFPPNADDDIAFHQDDDNDDIDEEEEKEIMQYRRVIRRLSENLNKDSLGAQDNQDHDDHSLGDVSLSSDHDDSRVNQNETSDDQNDTRIKFIIGTTPPSTSDFYNNAFESDDNDHNDNQIKTENIDNQVNKSMFTFRPRRINRSISLDNDNSNVAPYSQTSVDNKPTTDTKKAGVINVFKKGLRRSRKTSTSSTTSAGKMSNGNGHVSHGGDESERENNNSDGDSDGFVDSEPDDNENYTTNDIVHIKRKKRKAAIPINQYEDVNCIY